MEMKSTVTLLVDWQKELEDRNHFQTFKTFPFISVTEAD